MTFLSQFGPLLISLLGFVCGIMLAKIAKDELEDGKKYFILMKKILFFAVSFLIIYSFVITAQYLYLILFLILSTVVFIQKQTPTTEMFTYIIFIIPYFFLQHQILLSSLIFLYGLPTGTLWQATKI